MRNVSTPLSSRRPMSVPVDWPPGARARNFTRSSLVRHRDHTGGAPLHHGRLRLPDLQ